MLEGILGADIDCFQSQLIFKNPGAWGQPWHQDSYYFRFTHQPQAGVWLALTEATIENGCLFVLPGSHNGDIHKHGPDTRPSANYGYTEIQGLDFSSAEPCLMQAGDILVFHSYLVHRSVDNKAAGRRAALVYHFGRAGTAMLPGEAENPVVDFMPVRRRPAA